MPDKVNFTVIVAALLVSHSLAKADLVKLSGGESVPCTVVSVDRHFVRVSEPNGNARSFIRAGVQTIFFGIDTEADNAAVMPADEPSRSTPAGLPSHQRLVPEDFRREMPADPDAEIYRMERDSGVRAVDRQQTPADVVRQLQYDGQVPAETLDELFRTFPLLNDPQAKRYFDQTVDALITGEKSLEDLRQDAIAARARLEAVRNVLGPEGSSMIQNYTDVLDRFIEQAAPAGNP